MAKIVIINSSALGEGCWSPLRYCGSCEKCNKIEKCKHKEAINGRRIILSEKLSKAQEKVNDLKTRIKENNDA